MRKLLVAATLTAVVATACSDTGRVPPPAPTSNACVESGQIGQASVPWDRLRNPVYSLPNAAVKDVAIRLVDGRWRMLFSDVREDPFRFRIGLTSSTDLTNWSTVDVWDDPKVGGVASPDVTRDASGAYVVTYNSHTRDVKGLNKLYARTSLDFENWSTPQRLAFDLRPKKSDRLIDAALAHTPAGLVLGYNYQENRFEVAISPSGSLDGPWRRIGTADTGPLENVQFLQVNGEWYVLGTAVPEHHERLYVLHGSPGDATNWRHWDLVRELNVPSQSWNHAPGEVANAAYLCDARALDGHWYLLYSGSTELDRFNGRGWAKVGIARSTDLVTWEVPPER